MKKFVRLLLCLLISAMAIASAACAPQDAEIPGFTTKFIAHRGLSSQYYENSEAAFLNAAQSDFFWGIETDFWCTADGVWVCAHDENPFADPSITLTSITYAEAAVLPLKQNTEYSSVNHENVYLCSAERYLEICSQHNKIAVIEIKYQADEEELASLIAFVAENIALDKTIFISFYHAVISSLKELSDEITTMALVSNLFNAAVYMDRLVDIGIKNEIITDELLAMCKEKGILVNVWTVNNIQTAQSLVEKKVDFITTDYIFDLASI